MTDRPVSTRLTGSSTGRIRKLGGFSKHHHVPDTCSSAAQNFVRKVGHPEVKSVAEGLHRDIRELFGYKRRELDYSCEDGSALIKTPDFDLEIHVDQSTQDPKNYVLSTSVTRLHNPQIAQDSRFHQCFTHYCDLLQVEFAQAVDLEAKIDRIEDIPELANCLDYAPDVSCLELKLPSLDLHIRVSETGMSFELLTLSNLEKLLSHSQKAFDILTQAGFGLRFD